MASAAVHNVNTNYFMELRNARQTSFIYLTTNLASAGGDVGLSLCGDPTNRG